jgi:hypothetical protein
VVYYVAAQNSIPVAPYTSWATAASNIQEAVDAANALGALVLVGDGTYANGGRAIFGTMTNRLAIDRPLRVQSLNGQRSGLHCHPGMAGAGNDQR